MSMGKLYLYLFTFPSSILISLPLLKKDVARSVFVCVCERQRERERERGSLLVTLVAMWPCVATRREYD